MHFIWESSEIAFRLGKRYAQDESLSFGVVTTLKAAAAEAHKLSFKESGTTRRKSPETPPWNF
jgi:hypothetical protein